MKHAARLARNLVFVAPSLLTVAALAQPAIDTLVPVSGPPGTAVTLTGSGFDPSGNRVRVGSELILGLDSEDNGTVISVTIPELPAGLYGIRVRSVSGFSNTLDFEVTSGCSQTLPIPAPPMPDPPAPTDQSSFRCTQVIGFSQTGNWFEPTDPGGFLDTVDDTRWQLLRQNGSNIDFWLQPDYQGWDQALIEPCVQSSTRPDRIVLTISGNSQTDPLWWRDNILAAVDTLLNGVNNNLTQNPDNLADNGVRYGRVREVVLQPVVGGPGDGFCAFPAEEPVDGCNVVRASANHTFVDEGIFLAVQEADFPGVLVSAGVSAEVTSCADYSDSKGHIRSAAQPLVGGIISAFYASN